MKMFFNGLQFKLISKSIGLIDFCGFVRVFSGGGLLSDEELAEKTAFCCASSYCIDFRDKVEGSKLKYLSYAQSGDNLEIVQANNLISVSSGIKAEKSGALKIKSVINNLCGKNVTVGNVTAFKAGGFCSDDLFICGADDLSPIKKQNEKFCLSALFRARNKINAEILNEVLGESGIKNTNKWVLFDKNRGVYLAFCYDDGGSGWELLPDGNYAVLKANGKTSGGGEVELTPEGGEFVSRVFIISQARSAEEALFKTQAVSC